VSEMTDIAEAMGRKQAEAKRLVDTLCYYEWLEQHSVDPMTIQGVRRLTLTDRGYDRPLAMKIQRSKGKWVESPRRGRTKVYPRPGDQLSLKLKDGTDVNLDWPPFDDDVIYNKSRI